MSDVAWWRSFYDGDYLLLWGAFYDEAASRAHADAIVSVLGLAPGARVLDAPCGFGRLSRPLAARGAEPTRSAPHCVSTRSPRSSPCSTAPASTWSARTAAARPRRSPATGRPPADGSRWSAGSGDTGAPARLGRSVRASARLHAH